MRNDIENALREWQEYPPTEISRNVQQTLKRLPSKKRKTRKIFTISTAAACLLLIFIVTPFGQAAWAAFSNGFSNFINGYASEDKNRQMELLSEYADAPVPTQKTSLPVGVDGVYYDGNTLQVSYFIESARSLTEEYTPSDAEIAQMPKYEFPSKEDVEAAQIYRDAVENDVLEKRMRGEPCGYRQTRTYLDTDHYTPDGLLLQLYSGAYGEPGETVRGSAETEELPEALQDAFTLEIGFTRQETLYYFDGKQDYLLDHIVAQETIPVDVKKTEENLVYMGHAEFDTYFADVALNAGPALITGQIILTPTGDEEARAAWLALHDSENTVNQLPLYWSIFDAEGNRLTEEAAGIANRSGTEKGRLYLEVEIAAIDGLPNTLELRPEFSDSWKGDYSGNVIPLRVSEPFEASIDAVQYDGYTLDLAFSIENGDPVAEEFTPTAAELAQMEKVGMDRVVPPNDDYVLNADEMEIKAIEGRKRGEIGGFRITRVTLDGESHTSDGVALDSNGAHSSIDDEGNIEGVANYSLPAELQNKNAFTLDVEIGCLETLYYFDGKQDYFRNRYIPRETISVEVNKIGNVLVYAGGADFDDYSAEVELYASPTQITGKIILTPTGDEETREEWLALLKPEETAHQLPIDWEFFDIAGNRLTVDSPVKSQSVDDAHLYIDIEINTQDDWPDDLELRPKPGEDLPEDYNDDTIPVKIRKEGISKTYTGSAVYETYTVEAEIKANAISLTGTITMTPTEAFGSTEEWWTLWGLEDAEDGAVSSPTIINGYNIPLLPWDMVDAEGNSLSDWNVDYSFIKDGNRLIAKLETQVLGGLPDIFELQLVQYIDSPPLPEGYEGDSILVQIAE